MDYEQILETVQTRSGLSEEMATLAARSTLACLGSVVHPGDRPLVAQRLVEPLKTAFLSREAYHGTWGLEDFFSKVCVLEGVEDAFGREHAEVVCQVLSESFTEENLKLVQSRLPKVFADYLGELRAIGRPSVRQDTGAHAKILSGRGDTLATGRPGSAQPVSEAIPRDAHTHSVAASDNPHGDRKLSSGRPGAENAISDYTGDEQA